MAMLAIDVLMILIMNIPLIHDHETYDHHQCNQHENHNEYVEELKLEWNLLDLGFVCQSHPKTIWVGSETCQDIIVLIFQHSYSDIECQKWRGPLLDHKFVDGAESSCWSSSSSLFIFPFIINFRVLSPFWCPPGIEVNWQKLQRNYLDYDNNVLVLYCYTLSSVYIFKRRNFDVWRWHKSFCMNIE